jgi:bifunctional DNA-binding transcriptional regulator/antitoxin component of YhaV-PrlF toxin-antitoxin module
LTLPREVCEQLEAKIGDRLLMTIEDKTLILRPSKQVALDALREIQRAFAASGITEEELQESGRQIRRELIRERYGIGE